MKLGGENADKQKGANTRPPSVRPVSQSHLQEMFPTAQKDPDANCGALSGLTRDGRG